MKNITLYCQEGSSDKEYQVVIRPKESGYVVDFAYGRRGTSLKAGTKTTHPVDIETASKIFDSLVKEKTKGGYLPQHGSTDNAYTPVGEANDTGVRPQLLNAITDQERQRLLNDDDYIAQEKNDGTRCLLIEKGTSVITTNRSGLEVSHHSCFDKLSSLNGDFVLDGEMVKLEFVAFDMLQYNSIDLKRTRFEDRLQMLFNFLDDINPDNEIFPFIKQTLTATELVGKLALNELLVRKNAEGIVFKHRDSHYTPGRPASGGTQLKYKFFETASFVVNGINDKRSISLSLTDENGQTVTAGNVTIPANFQIPQPGEICEVRYLYAFKQSGSVFQPVYLGTRNDIPTEDCVTKQLKYKAE